MSRVSEATLESNIVKWAKGQGGLALKGSNTFDTGFPDRILYLPKWLAHVEVKGSSTSYHLREKQKVWAGRIIATGAPYYIIESIEGLEHMKKQVGMNPHTLTDGMYSLNGRQLYMYVDITKTTYKVHTVRDGVETRILTGMMRPSLADTIYYVFKRLEEAFPNTNYEDM